MRFLDPSQLAWASLAGLALLLYFFRRKPRRVPVSTLLFFKSLAREHQESSWLRRLKRLLSILLTLAVILGATGALAKLVVSPAADEVKSVVIVVDRSASMGAHDASGVTRLDEALDRVRERLAGLSGAVPVLLLASDARTEVALPRSYDRRSLERALNGLEVRPLPGKLPRALEMAGKFAALETPAAIWLASDVPPPEMDLPRGVRLEPITVALAEPRNVGLTAFDIRRRPLETGQYEAFVQLQATGPAPLETKLEVRIDDTLTAVRKLTLTPGERENLLLPIDASSGRILTLRAISEGDQLAADNELQARIPELKPLRVVWITHQPDPFTQLALAALGDANELSVFTAGPDAWPIEEKVDAVIFQGWLPEKWPEAIPVIVIDPPGTSGPLQARRIQEAGLPVENLRSPHERHPLLHGVATARIALTQTAALPSGGALEALWIGPAGPVLAAGDVKGQRIVVMGFAPALSEKLPLSASWPLLLGNAIHWVSQPERDVQSTRTWPTGELLRTKGNELFWVDAEGAKKAREAARNGWVSLDRIGLWKTDENESGGAALLSEAETLLPASPAMEDVKAARAPWWRGDLTGILLGCALGALVLESWLFHRHAVH